LITDRDAGALKYLSDLRIEYLPSSEPKPGFKLIFEFSPNEYFENDVLKKTYVYREEVGYSGDFVYDRAIGTEIRWKDEKDLTKEFEIKKQRNKSVCHILSFVSLPLISGLLDTNRTRLVRKAHPTQSFFNFFSPPVAPSEDAIEAGEIGEDELDDLEEKLEIDYQIGEDIKEKVRLVWPSFLSLSLSVLVCRLYRVPSTTSPARPLNTRCSLMMMTSRTRTRTKMVTGLTTTWYATSFSPGLVDRFRVGFG
jgi:hypothetical protein